VVNGNSVQSGSELALRLEGAQFGDDLNQNFLSRVFRQIASPNHSNCDVEYPSLVTAHQPLERLPVPGLSFGNQFFVRNGAILRAVSSERIMPFHPRHAV
jgi:hypothetical protein